MTKTVYVVVHIDYPDDELLTAILDPNEESKPTIYLQKNLAEEALNDYLENGLEYTLRILTLQLN